MKTENLVYEMLTENTGKAMCDSGGTDGRMWQRNQKKTIEDFRNEDEEVYSFYYKGGEIGRTVSVFHYLTNNLELDDICDEFNKIQEETDNWNSTCDAYGVSDEAWTNLNEVEIENEDDPFEIVRGNEVETEGVWNTYNGDSDLSQILQGANLIINDEHYVLIQIHNGADARGGYTDAKLFKCGEYCDGRIHEYLSEYSYIEDDLEEGHIDTFIDYMDESKTYTLEEVRNRILEI